MATWAAVWTTSYGALTSSQIDNNAQIGYDYLRNNGYTIAAALGVLANLNAEGGMNPGQWEHGYNYSTSRGFGLGQWTPSTKFSDWLGVSAGSRSMMNGDKQMEYLVENTGQWSTIYVASNGYSSYYKRYTIYFASQSDYAKDDTHTPADLAIAWACQWERPGSSYLNSSATARKNYANHFADVLNLGGSLPEAYTITIEVEGNGTATASAESASEGDTITLTATPNEGDTFSEWQVVSGNVTITDNTFTMPAEDVIIKAVFTGETPEPELETKKKSKWIYYMRPAWTTIKR